MEGGRDWTVLTQAEAAVVEGLARKAAREEIASFAGLVLRRLGETTPASRAGGRPGRGRELESIFGEVLRDFGSTGDEPGQG